MMIEIYLQDENGVPALFKAETTCLALDSKDVNKMENFRPKKFTEIAIFQDDGYIFRWLPSWRK